MTRHWLAAVFHFGKWLRLVGNQDITSLSHRRRVRWFKNDEHVCFCRPFLHVCPDAVAEMPARFSYDQQFQACRYLVIDFGTSKSPKSTRQRDNHYCPGRPASVPLRQHPRTLDAGFAALPQMTGRDFSYAYLVFPLRYRTPDKQCGPGRYRGLTAFASLSMAVSDCFACITHPGRTSNSLPPMGRHSTSSPFQIPSPRDKAVHLHHAEPFPIVPVKEFSTASGIVQSY